MSGAEFPLTLLLQVQDDMSAGVSSAASSMDELDTAAQKAEGSTSTLQSRVSTGGGDFIKFGLGIAAAAGSIINLVRQYHNLQRAQTSLTVTQDREKKAQLSLTDAEEGLKKARREHGKNSKEAEKAERRLEKARLTAKGATLRLENAQISLNDRMADFAFSIVPSVIGIVAGLSQVFQVFGGGGGLGGLGAGFLKLGGIMAAAGVVLFAIKTNLFGVRDAIQQFGFQLGQAVPALQPFLTFIQDVGIALGLLPGDATKAKLGIKGFSDNVKKWAGEAWKMVQDTVQQFMKDPIQTVIDIAVGVGKMITDVKVGGFSLGQWIAGLPIVISGLIEKEGPVLAIIDIITNIGNMLLPPDSQIKSQFDAWMARLKAKFIGFSTNPGTGFRGIFEAIWDNLINGPEALRPFKGKDVFAQPFADMQANWDMRVKQFQAFLVAHPIFGQIASNITQILGTLGNIQGQIVTFLANNFWAPIANAWTNTLIPAVENFVKTNPIFTKIMVGDWMGALTDVAAGIETWLIDNIATPLGSAWATLTNAVTTFINDHPIFGTATDFINKILGTVNFAAGQAKLWFQKNILLPIQKEWNSIADELLKATGGIIDIGKITLVPSDVAVDLRNSKFINKMNDLANKGFRGQGGAGGLTVPTGTVTLDPSGVIVNVDDIIGGSIGCGAMGGGFSGGNGCQLPMAGTLTIVPNKVNVSLDNATAPQLDTTQMANLSFTWQVVQQVIETGINTLFTLFNTVLPQAISSTGAMFTILATLFTQASTTIQQGINTLFVSFTTILPQAITTIQISLSSLATLFNTASTTIQTGINTLFVSFIALATQIITVMAPVFTTLSTGFSGLAATVSAVMNSMGANAVSGANQIITAMAKVFTTVSAGFSGLASTVSAVMNSMGANAKSGASQIIAAMKSMASQVTSIFNALLKAAQKTFTGMASAAVSAVSKIKSALSSIPKVTNVTVNVGVTGPGVKFLAGGYHGVVNKPTLMMVGEAGAERVDVSPLGKSRSGSGLTTSASMNVNPRVSGGSHLGGGGGTTIVQVFLDGTQMKGKVVQMLARNQSVMK